jgi:chitinase
MNTNFRQTYSLIRIYAVLMVLLGSVALSCAQIRVVGYYPAWLRTTLPAAQIEYEHLTHIIHAFAWPDRFGNLAHYGDLLYPELITRTHAAGKHILLALGGWGQSEGFAPMVADSNIRKTFIGKVIQFCDDNGYDGVDLDWEYPSTLTEKNNLNLFVQELYQAFRARGKDWIISMAIPAGDWAGQWFDYTFLQQYVAWFGCMTYDFMGSWVPIATHNAPLYSHPDQPYGSVHAAVQYLTDQRKIAAALILIGLPFYGKGCNATGLFQPNTGGNVEYYYSQIKLMIGNGWTYYWDSISQVPYLLNATATQFITFDDTNSVRLKCEYAREKGLGGVMIWALGQDLINAHQPLLETTGRTLFRNTGMGRQQPIRPGTYPQLRNFPNPFNEATFICFYVPTEEWVKLEIFDYIGRSIQTLLNQKAPQGWHILPFEAVDLASGSYFCKLTSASFSKTTKLSVLK